MPLVLVDTRTGKRHPPRLRPKRVGLGPLDDRTAAVLAPFDGGWVVVPLRRKARIAVNGAAIDRPTPLAAGDTLTLGPCGYRVEQCGSPAAEPAPALATQGVCRVAVRFQHVTVADTAIVAAAVIGTGAGCRVRVPASTGLRGEHTVLAHVGGRWHLFDLTSQGASRFGCAEQTAVGLVPGESVWLGEVEVTVTCEEVDPLDHSYGVDCGVSPPTRGCAATSPTGGEVRSGPASSGSLPPGGGGVGWGGQTVPHETVSAVQHTTETPRNLPDVAGRLLPADETSRAVRTAARRLCTDLVTRHRFTPPHPAPELVAAVPLATHPDRFAGSVADIEEFRRELDADPWNPTALFRFAAYLRGIGLTDHARWALKEVFRQNVADAVVLESLGAFSRGQAADPARPAADRLVDREKAAKYFAKAAAARAAHPPRELTWP